MSFALDANVLLYAANRSCDEHERAHSFLQQCAKGGELMCFTWPTLMAFLRISTHPAIFPSPLSWQDARDHVQALLELQHVRVLGELDGFWQSYHEITQEMILRGNLISDAHLAATLKQNGVRTLYTRDRDFLRFPFLTIRDPLKM